MKPKSAHRYRICGTPVRTGCITCKIRRVKCDEEKPFCKRCTNTGRKCDGYAPPGQPPTAPRKTTAKVDTSCNNLDGPMEQDIFHFFSTTSAFQLSGNLSTDFWQRRVIQASAVEPSIRHAAIAIGAVHQEYIKRHENKGNAHDPSLKAFAFRQYTKAISHLHSMMATQTQQLDFTLISCILFICFDCITGNHDSAIIHLKAGLKILEDIKKQNARSSLSVQNTSAHEWEKEFAPMLLGLGVQAASFVNPKYFKDQAHLWMMLKGARASTYPATFHSIDEARHALETTISDIMADRTKSAIDSIGPCPIPKLDKLEILRHHSEMESWTHALNNYLGMYEIEPPHNVTLAANMLKVHWLVISMTLSYPKTSDAKFLELISLCESIVPEYGSDPFAASNMFFSMDLGIVCPLFLAAVRAPKMYIRRQALELLTRAPRREGMWDSDDAILVATEAIRRAQTREDPITFKIAEESPENELWMWNDISQRLRSGFSWPSAHEQQVEISADLSTSFTHVFSMRSSPEGSCPEGSGKVFSDENPAERQVYDIV